MQPEALLRALRVAGAHLFHSSQRPHRLSGIQWTLNARLSELVLLAYACCQEAATEPAHGKRS